MKFELLNVLAALGMAASTLAQRSPPLEAAAPRPPRRAPGVERAAVVSTEDPAGAGRVRVALPSGELWAPVVHPVGGSQAGPPLAAGDVVVVAFLSGDPGRPVVLGTLQR